jgi:hypothetical protein
MHNDNRRADAVIVSEKWQLFDTLPTNTVTPGLTVKQPR